MSLPINIAGNTYWGLLNQAAQNSLSGMYTWPPQAAWPQAPDLSRLQGMNVELQTQIEKLEAENRRLRDLIDEFESQEG